MVCTWSWMKSMDTIPIRTLYWHALCPCRSSACDIIYNQSQQDNAGGKQVSIEPHAGPSGVTSRANQRYLVLQGIIRQGIELVKREQARSGTPRDSRIECGRGNFCAWQGLKGFPRGVTEPESCFPLDLVRTNHYRMLHKVQTGGRP